jgi:tryptophan synthase alpha chain
MGITGTKKPSISKVKKSVLGIKKVTNLPILIGFGINSSKQTREINKFADGYVIGSAIINLIEDTKYKKYSSSIILSKIKLFLSNLK